jgi:hypothetical protein
MFFPLAFFALYPRVNINWMRICTSKGTNTHPVPWKLLISSYGEYDFVTIFQLIRSPVLEGSAQPTLTGQVKSNLAESLGFALAPWY